MYQPGGFRNGDTLSSKWSCNSLLHGCVHVYSRVRHRHQLRYFDKREKLLPAASGEWNIIFFHISQTAVPDLVGIHNPAPEAVFEVTTHANVKNSMRLSRMLAVGSSDNAGPTYRIGTYRVSKDGKKIVYMGPQLQAASDGNLFVDSGGKDSNNAAPLAVFFVIYIIFSKH